MRYAVVFTNTAQRDLSRLRSSIQGRVEPLILSREEMPRPKGVKKLQGYKDYYRIRLGDYRIIYQINDAENSVVIARILHRREAYR